MEEESKQCNFKGDDMTEACSRLRDRYTALQSLSEIFPNSSQINKEEKEKISVTDLFIEKDIIMLENRADKLQRTGNNLFILVLLVFITAATISSYQMLFMPITETDWVLILVGFLRSFTAYGLMILIGVTAWKHSKASHDQAERLYSKRRANRLFRLNIHLNKGSVDIKEMIELLSFNSTENNAHASIEANAKAPWGNVVSELISASVGIINATTNREKEENNRLKLENDKSKLQLEKETKEKKHDI